MCVLVLLFLRGAQSLMGSFCFGLNKPILKFHLQLYSSSKDLSNLKFDVVIIWQILNLILIKQGLQGPYPI
ncbi:hypothetical protein O6H91_05G025600 [Diphasiastrum complanatum]|uniref:Uncharacterized protein n=1 Tax=Diphasiastrum complanatum TaxID=34168 RepID=A0ACC2DM68_DIPCM|nr:hypothetical protein O6H91_05G025600 [Diphasiastrum complanatum]